MLDISNDNIASEMVAKKCGFTKPGDRTGYFDMEHPEVGMRFRWFKQLAGGRTTYFNQAVHCYRQKQYADAVEAFKMHLMSHTPLVPHLRMPKYIQTWVWHCLHYVDIQKRCMH